MSKLRPGGGYRDTASFQTATIIYDGTYWFCEKFMDSRSRTVDQMVQAARSGRQNIAECPQCGRAMVLRTAKGGRNPGSQFWGCSAYPECKGVINV